jgi:aryl-alcohol dehydrogenase-like predicted oxidoreductase
MFNEPQLSDNLALVDKLRPIAGRNGMTLSQLAIAWVLRRPEVTAAIVGARRPSQIEETVPAGDMALPTGDIAEIEEFIAERERAIFMSQQ